MTLLTFICLVCPTHIYKPNMPGYVYDPQESDAAGKYSNFIGTHLYGVVNISPPER